MDTLWQDVKFGIRMLVRKPAFTAFAVGVLALGIAANTSIFSLADAVLLRALPYRDASRLVMVWEDSTFYGFAKDTPAPGNFTAWKARNTVFQDMAATREGSYNLTGDGPPEQILGRRVTSNLFSVLGVQPLLGRDFLEQEDHPETNRVVILSHGLWLRRFGGDPRVVGRAIVLDNQNYSVIGVMPRGFQFPDRDAQIWVPAGMSDKVLQNRDSHYLQVYARLKPGVTLAQANANLSAIAGQLARETPNTNEHVGAVVLPLRDELAGNLKFAVYVLLAAVVFVLLIACANVANLLLARSAARQREIALRMAMGAGRGRILRQLLTESLLLSLLAGALGLLLSTWFTGLLATLIPGTLPKISGSGLDSSVLAFAVAITCATSVFFGIVPALRVSRVNLNSALKQGGGRSVAGFGSRRTRDALVVVEFALAIVLLAGAGLMIRSFLALRGLDPGFRTDHVIAFRTPLTGPKYKDPNKKTQFFDLVLARVAALPGVASVGYSTWLPLTNYGGAMGFSLEGQPPPRPGEADVVNIANVRLINPDYLKTISVPIKEGRWLDAHDSAQAAPVALINAQAARQFWPGRDPVGLHFKFGSSLSHHSWITVVGIVGDMHQAGLAVPPRPEMYFPYWQQMDLGFDPDYLAVKVAGDPAKLVKAVSEQVWAVDKDQPVSGGYPLGDLTDEEIAPWRTQTDILGAFAGMALILAALGIYAVLSFAVTQRTQEIGIRMALGAPRESVLRLILGEGLKLMFIGIAAGWICAAALSRVITHLLYGIGAMDSATFLSVPAILALVGLVACWIPAHRATRVDPLVALRYE